MIAVNFHKLHLSSTQNKDNDMSASKLLQMASLLDEMSASEKRASRNMVLDAFGAGELAEYLIQNWGSIAANAVARKIQANTETE